MNNFKKNVNYNLLEFVLLMRFTKFAHQEKKWSRGRVARQWSAKPSTPVRIWSRPPTKTPSLFIKNQEGVFYFNEKPTFFLPCHKV